MNAVLTAGFLLFLFLSGCLGGPPVLSPASGDVPGLREDAFVSADGFHHPLRAFLPSGSPRAVVVALHGFNDYSHAFAGAGQWFADRGVALYAYDQRGFGATAGRGLWHGQERLAGDVAEIAREMVARHPGAPLFLLGESMGGAVLLDAQARHALPVAGLILSAPAVWRRADMPWYQRSAFFVTAHLFPWLLVTGEGLGITPSDNEEMLRALSRDPWVIKETRMDTLWGLGDLMDATVPALERLRLPTLVLYGAHDEIIPARTMAVFEKHLPRQVVMVRFDRGYHMLLRDKDGSLVLERIRGWLEQEGGLSTP